MILAKSVEFKLTNKSAFEANEAVPKNVPLIVPVICEPLINEPVILVPTMLTLAVKLPTLKIFVEGL